MSNRLMPSRSVRILARVLLLVAAVLLALFVVVRPVRLCTYRIRFSTLPADDAALTAWLRAQPELSLVTVSREGQKVTLQYTADFFRYDVRKLLGALERLGYQREGGIPTVMEISWEPRWGGPGAGLSEGAVTPGGQ